MIKTEARRQLVIEGIDTIIVLIAGLLQNMSNFGKVGIALLAGAMIAGFCLSGIQIAGWNNGNIARLECILYIIQCILFVILALCQLFGAISVVMSLIVCVVITVSYVYILNVVKNVRYD